MSLVGDTGGGEDRIGTTAPEKNLFTQRPVPETLLRIVVKP